LAIGRSPKADQPPTNDQNRSGTKPILVRITSYYTNYGYLNSYLIHLHHIPKYFYYYYTTHQNENPQHRNHHFYESSATGHELSPTHTVPHYPELECKAFSATNPTPTKYIAPPATPILTISPTFRFQLGSVAPLLPNFERRHNHTRLDHWSVRFLFLAILSALLSFSLREQSTSTIPTNRRGSGHTTSQVGYNYTILAQEPEYSIVAFVQKLQGLPSSFFLAGIGH
jgi:hypothetical protein